MIKNFSKIIVFFVFVFLAFFGYLMYRQIGSLFSESNPVFSSPTSTTILVQPDQIEIEPTQKILKHFGHCGPEDKNDIILSYPPELLNALMDGVLESHCQAPTPDFPNYTFLLKDPSVIRLAEMTPDFKNIFYLTAAEGKTHSHYTLYRVDIEKKITTLLDEYDISNDWPLQRDFFEQYLMPTSRAGGKYIVYNWFIADPKGNSKIQDYLRGKIIHEETNTVVQSPCGQFLTDTLIISPNEQHGIFTCDTGKESVDGKVILFYTTNFQTWKEVNVPQNREAPRHFEIYFIDNDTFAVGYGGLPFVIDIPKF